MVLTLSAGPRTGTLPPLVGRDVTAARGALEELGLDLTVTTEVGYDDDLPPGTVLLATPAGGATVEEGTEVVLTVSDGPAPVDLPDLTGKLEGAASAELVGLGLVARVVERRRPAATRQVPPIGVDAEEEPGIVRVVGERLHPRGEGLGVLDQLAGVSVAIGDVAVVEVEVLVAEAGEAARDQRVGGLAEDALGHVR